MFIFIWEDGTISKGDTFQVKHLRAVKDGILEVITTVKPGEPWRWDGEWVCIDEEPDDHASNC